MNKNNKINSPALQEFSGEILDIAQEDSSEIKSLKEEKALKINGLASHSGRATLLSNAFLEKRVARPECEVNK